MAAQMLLRSLGRTAWGAAHSGRGFATRAGFKPAPPTGATSISTASLAVGGALILGGTAYFSYRYARAHAVLPTQGDTPAGSGAPASAAPVADSYRIFDIIADKYDDAIGQEEAALWYGMMRKWLLQHAAGDVLEISVGTGRNFKYYDFSKGRIGSLTCTDLSNHMLLRAEDKYFDELNLGHRHPDVRVRFCLADAHCLVAPAPERSGRQAGSGAEGASAGKRSGWWWHGSRASTSGDSRSQQPHHEHAAGGLEQLDDDEEEEAVPYSTVHSVAGGTRELPGINAGGILNLFRVLAPRSSPPTPGSADPATAGPATTAEDAALPAAGSAAAASAAPSAGAQAAGAGAGAASSSERERGVAAAESCGCGSSRRADGGGCDGGAADLPTCSYAGRCAAGRLESGQALARFAPHSFDTVVDTFGLCSHEDPVRVLREMVRVCKPGGKILLLQHGRSYYDWLNRTLDDGAAKHQQKWGCLWNKDIMALVEQAGLVVEKNTRWHFGTSYFIVARPPPTKRAAAAARR